MELTIATRTTEGKNELLDIALEELNVKEVSIVDNQGRIIKTYNGRKTTEYQYQT